MPKLGCLTKVLYILKLVYNVFTDIKVNRIFLRYPVGICIYILVMLLVIYSLKNIYIFNVT